MYDKTLIYILKQRVLWPSTGDATSQVTMKVSGAQGHKRLFPEVLVVSKCLLNHVTDKIRNKKRDMPICCLNLCFWFMFISSTRQYLFCCNYGNYCKLWYTFSHSNCKQSNCKSCANCPTATTFSGNFCNNYTNE